MNALAWPQLYQRLVDAGLQVTKDPGPDGWAWARCPNAGAHENGDLNPSLRLNVKVGSAKCMSRACVAPTTLNGLASLMGVSIYSGAAQTGHCSPPVPKDPHSPQMAVQPRWPSLVELSDSRGLPVEFLRRLGVAPVRDGWSYPIDDADATAWRRIKALPGRGPKYYWSPRGCPAGDLVYGLSRLSPQAEDLIICAGEPDAWVLTYAGYQPVSFVAGEGTAPSSKAWDKLRVRAPRLRAVFVPYDNDQTGRAGAVKIAAAAQMHGFEATIVTLPASLGDKGDVSDLWVQCGTNRYRFESAFDALILKGQLYAAPPIAAPASFDSFLAARLVRGA